MDFLIWSIFVFRFLVSASITEYFRAGWSTDSLTRGRMPVTLSRLNLVKGSGLVLQLAEGFIVEQPARVHDALDSRTNFTWPTTWSVPCTAGSGTFRDAYSVMNAWGAAFSYDHIEANLVTLASMLRIPVNMHNVSEEKIFRPSTWSAFGMADLESADFRACHNFGLLYG